MTSLVLRISFVAFVVPLALAACGSSAAESTGATAQDLFLASTVVATRTPAACGLTEPTFSSKDTFTLEVAGHANGPYKGLTLEFPALVPVEEAIALSIEPPPSVSANVETADAFGSLVKLTLSTESNATAGGDARVVSAAVTVHALPTADGQPLDAEVQLSLMDGTAFDQTYAGTLRTALVLCSHES
jgi:hypothetical protein